MATDRTNSENQLLEDLVEIYSPSGQERRAAEFLLKAFQNFGWKATIDEAGSVIGEIGEGWPTTCFLGHIDTVTGKIPVRRDGNLLYGRGTVDAKGPLAAAACAAARLGRNTTKKITIVGAVGEEAPNSPGASHVVHRLRPDFAIIGEPSHWDRITIGYKGILQFRYTLEGPRTHGAASEASVATTTNAFLARIKELTEQKSKGEKSPFHTWSFGIRSISAPEDRDSEALYETATASVDLRLPPGLNPDDVEKMVRNEAGKGRIEIVESLPAVVCDKNNSLVRTLLAAIRQHGGRPRFVLKTGTSDMNVVAPVWKCPMVAYGPGDSRLDHAPDEHIDLDEYQRAIAVLETTFRNL